MKTVVITGANRGLGKALTNRFHQAGWYVIATARDIASLPDDTHITGVELDLADDASIQALAAVVAKKGRKIDLVINNAGYNPKDSSDKDYFQSTFKISHFSGKNVAKSLQINALAPTELVSKLLAFMAEDAVVLNISSWLGSIATKEIPGHYGYAGSKALLNMFTKAMALEFAETPRSAIALNPGWMRTDMGGARAEITPEDVAERILSLYESGQLHANNGAFLNTDGSHHLW